MTPRTAGRSSSPGAGGDDSGANLRRSLSRTLWVRSESGITTSVVARPVVASCRMCWIFHFVQNSLDLDGGMGR